jgi:diaminohydroxyphosphoribosylaminopyrimidine deaminase/5-amino-6-(5-phosphoribosylamino)uracil reductase
MNLDAVHMRAALEEARKGLPSPNPHVGAIVVSSVGEVVGRGYHAAPGRGHAEVEAIRDAGERSRGATLYVTLEPCNHHGRTPPCTDAILAAGIARVVVGVRDPNPHVEGHGNERLRAAGIEIVEGVEGEACARLIAPFAKHVRTGRPFVRLKLAASLDGRIAAAPEVPGARGISRWITGPEARARVHRLRREVDAVAVGIGTALADDPALTPRDAGAIEARTPPIRIVFDPRARLPHDSVLARTATTDPTWIVADPAAETNDLEAAGVRVLRAPAHDLGAALDRIGEAGVVDLLVEGGSRIAGALVAHDLVDELWWFSAPIALGERASPAIVGLAPSAPDRAPRWSLRTLERCGEDALLIFDRRT